MAPELSENAFKTLLSRAVSAGKLVRICRGIYGYPKKINSSGILLFHVAAYLRANEFNYISLETVLSQAGVISQIPMGSVSIMSSGRSSSISCGNYGTIEFIHTTKKPEHVVSELTYDSQARLWRASVALAIKDMKRSQRNLDLINWEVVDELI